VGDEKGRQVENLERKLERPWPLAVYKYKAGWSYSVRLARATDLVD
jgi:hypothetical protein